jgi:hypothetical protein
MGASTSGSVRRKRSLEPRSCVQSQVQLATGFAMLAGFVDAYGIITYNTYLSLMRGQIADRNLCTAPGTSKRKSVKGAGGGGREIDVVGAATGVGATTGALTSVFR